MAADIGIVTRCSSTGGQVFQLIFRQTNPTTWSAYKRLVPRVPPRPEDRRTTATRQARPSITGSFVVDPSYKGCPYCQARGFWKCGECEGLNCYTDDRSKGRDLVCMWCDHKGHITGTISQMTPGPVPDTGARAPGSPVRPALPASTPKGLPPR